MTAAAHNAKVDAFMERAKQWPEEFVLLRELLLASGLTEDLKWGQPCYSLDGRNVVLMHGFKDYCALLFFKGALLKDQNGILVQQTENVQSARQVRFKSAGEIKKLKAALKAYVAEAIEVEKSGQKVEFKKTAEFSMPEEFQRALGENSALRNAFEELTPGRQRAYLLHFSSAKQAKTREARIEKCTPMILDGLGLDDRG
jgi:uncharacterized protein YdeI (YjbR/CyaY-like superfamily)